MLDPRIYRAALIPAMLALIVAAFSLESPPRPLTAQLPPDSFSGPRAFGSLQELSRRFPDRRPGSRGDTALGSRVRTVLDNSGFQVADRRFKARTVRGREELRTVSGVRAGLSSRAIVVLAHRDSLARPGEAELSGTAALLELARVYEGRTLRKTLVLASTSGGTGGAAGAAEAARHLEGPVDAVLVLGDLAGSRLRRPVVVPWANSPVVAPVALRRTAEAAVRLETGLRSREPGLFGQFGRLGFPLTTGEQGPMGARSLPAVLISVSGERGPQSGDAVGRERFGEMGRAVLRTITALDAQPAAPPRPRAELLVARKLVPGWAVLILTGALILPVLLAAIDGFARVRRRRHPVGMWVAWVLAGAAPFALAALFALALALTGLMPTPPPEAAPPGAVPLDVGALATLGVTALVLLVGWLGVRPLLLRLAGVTGRPDSPGAAAALLLVFVAVVTAVWAFNPFAAALLLVPLHAWTLVVSPDVRMRRSVAVGLVVLSLIPVALVVLYYALAIGYGPMELVWNALLLAIGGHVGLLGVAAWCLLLGCLGSVLSIARSRRLTPPEVAETTTRGPLSYAGPGSLGGTESALRR